MEEDSAAVLGSGVATLAVFGRWVVHAVEEFKEGVVCYDRRIKGHLQSFGICGGGVSRFMGNKRRKLNEVNDFTHARFALSTRRDS